MPHNSRWLCDGTMVSFGYAQILTEYASMFNVFV
jgi:hypothetical protein